MCKVNVISNPMLAADWRENESLLKSGETWSDRTCVHGGEYLPNGAWDGLNVEVQYYINGKT